MNPWRTRIMV
jgi:hypothetical protein